MLKSVDMDPEGSTDNAHSIEVLSKCTYDQVSCRLFCYSSEQFDSGLTRIITTSISSSKSNGKTKMYGEIERRLRQFSSQNP